VKMQHKCGLLRGDCHYRCVATQCFLSLAFLFLWAVKVPKASHLIHIEFSTHLESSAVWFRFNVLH